jgi:hypothetical protein
MHFLALLLFDHPRPCPSRPFPPPPKQNRRKRCSQQTRRISWPRACSAPARVPASLKRPFITHTLSPHFRPRKPKHKTGASAAVSKPGGLCSQERSSPTHGLRRHSRLHLHHSHAYLPPPSPLPRRRPFSLQIRRISWPRTCSAHEGARASLKRLFNTHTLAPPFPPQTKTGASAAVSKPGGLCSQECSSSPHGFGRHSRPPSTTHAQITTLLPPYTGAGPSLCKPGGFRSQERSSPTHGFGCHPGPPRPFITHTLPSPPPFQKQIRRKRCCQQVLRIS